MNEGYFQELVDIYSKKDGDEFIIDDPNNQIKYRLSIFRNNFPSDESRDIFLSNIKKIENLTKYPGVLSIIYVNQQLPAIISEYTPNGTLHDYIEKHNHLTDTQKYIIIYGIVKTLLFLRIHHLYIEGLDSNQIYLNDHLYPQISLTNFLMKGKIETKWLLDPVYEFSDVAYEVITGIKPNHKIENDVSIGLKIDSFFLRKIIQNSWSNSRFSKQRYQVIISELESHKESFGDINEEEIKEYEKSLEFFLSKYSKEMKQKAIEKNAISSIIYGFMLYLGLGIEKNEKEAGSFFKFAADEGIKEGIIEYGFWLYYGKDLKKEAAPYLKIEADQGNLDFIFYYAHCQGLNKNFDECYKYFKIGADKGDADSIFYVGFCYLRGFGVEQNSEKAAQIFKSLCEPKFKHMHAMFYYAVMLSEGNGIKKDLKESARLHKISADEGVCSESASNYSIMAFNGEGIDTDFNAAKYYLKMAAELELEKAMVRIGRCYLSGLLFEQNKKEAVKYFKKAADIGNEAALELYSKMCYIGEGIEINKKEAFKYFKIGAEKGNKECMKFYTQMLINGEEVEIDKKEASKYYKILADDGDIDYIGKYAVMLSEGDGIDQDKKEAVKYFKIAADKGDEISMYIYAVMIQNGDGVDKNSKEAVKYFKMAADKGVDDAWAKLAAILYLGDGVDINKEEAFNYFKIAADIGHVQSMSVVGSLLKSGDGIQINKTEAAKYFKLAADNGDASSMFEYAEMLNNGDGIQMDRNEAIRYYRMASENGINEANANLRDLTKYITVSF